MKQIISYLTYYLIICDLIYVKQVLENYPQRIYRKSTHPMWERRLFQEVLKSEEQVTISWMKEVPLLGPVTIQNLKEESQREWNLETWGEKGTCRS